MIRMTCTLAKQGQLCLLLPSLVVKSDAIKGETRLWLAGTRSELVIDWYCRQRMERTLLALLLVTVAFAIVAEGKRRCSFSFYLLFYQNFLSWIWYTIFKNCTVFWLETQAAIYIVFLLQLDLNHWRKDYVLACPLSTAQQVQHKMKRASKLLGAQETDRQTDND